MTGAAKEVNIAAVDLFCGAGGLTHGLAQAGIRVTAGIDIDAAARYAFVTNNPGSRFYRWDIARKRVDSVASLFPSGSVKLLAGCAPCQPFSKLTNGSGQHKAWDLLDSFTKLIDGIRPELVTMENVPELANRGSSVFGRFTNTLLTRGYWFDWKIVHCEQFGVPQARKRLVLVASRLGPIKVPRGGFSRHRWNTVRKAISALPALKAGEACDIDPLHVSVRLNPTNLSRIRATPLDGGTWKDWPHHLLLKCHKRSTGTRYGSIYGRMWWDKPGPTMTTLCTGIGNGRFGHPEQDRAITLREASLLQGFPSNYDFWPSRLRLNRSAVARLIGNAVPPKLARSLGRALIAHVGLQLYGEPQSERRR